MLTLIEFVQGCPAEEVLCVRDSNHFETLKYDAIPNGSRVVLPRAGLSWNGLYEFLGGEELVVRLGSTGELRPLQYSLAR